MENGNLFGFNAEEVKPEEGGNYKPIPAGDYTVVLSKADMADTKSGGKMIKINAVVLDGEHEDRVVFDNVNIVNANPTAQEIGQARLSAICHAVGNLKPTDTQELLNIPIQITVCIQPAKDGYPESNKIRAYKALPAKKELVYATSSQPKYKLWVGTEKPPF